MPIRIPNELPAARTLKEENIFVMTENRAVTQDIRPPRPSSAACSATRLSRWSWSSSLPMAISPKTPPRSTCWPSTATLTT